MPQENTNTQKTVSSEQKLSLDNRSKMSITGVENVDSFSENEIVLITNLGKLTVKGENLSINMLNVDTGDFSMEGYVISLVYSKTSRNSKTSFIEKLFR